MPLPGGGGEILGKCPDQTEELPAPGWREWDTEPARKGQCLGSRDSAWFPLWLDTLASGSFSDNF